MDLIKKQFNLVKLLTLVCQICQFHEKSTRNGCVKILKASSQNQHVLTLLISNRREGRGSLNEGKPLFPLVLAHAPDKHFANIPRQRLGDCEMAAEVKLYLVRNGPVEGSGNHWRDAWWCGFMGLKLVSGA